MKSSFMRIGMKLDIMDEPTGIDEKDDAREIYTSQIQEIFPNGDLEIDMPTYQRKLVLLSNGGRYQIIFYTDQSHYVAQAKVVDRYKSGNRYFVRIELTSQPERFQRREFFRCKCLIELQYQTVTQSIIDKEPTEIFLKRFETEGMPEDAIRGVALDISGGGLRMVSRTDNEVGSILHFSFQLPIRGEIKQFHALGTVLSSELQKDSRVKYECRIKFSYLKTTDREDIIRYIFEEERKSRKLSRGK